MHTVEQAEVYITSGQLKDGLLHSVQTEVTDLLGCYKREAPVYSFTSVRPNYKRLYRMGGGPRDRHPA